MARRDRGSAGDPFAGDEFDSDAFDADAVDDSFDGDTFDDDDDEESASAARSKGSRAPAAGRAVSLSASASARGSSAPASTRSRPVARTRARERDRDKQEAGRGLIGRIVTFVREVVAELQKVIWPTRKELLTYTVVVIIFVTIVMSYVAGLDLGFAKLMFYVFGSGSSSGTTPQP